MRENESPKTAVEFSMAGLDQLDSRGPIQLDNTPLPETPVVDVIARAQDEQLSKGAGVAPISIAVPSPMEIIGFTESMHSFVMEKNTVPDFQAPRRDAPVEGDPVLAKRLEGLVFDDIYADSKIALTREMSEWRAAGA